jgi:hypothetical protein
LRGNRCAEGPLDRLEIALLGALFYWMRALCDAAESAVLSIELSKILIKSRLILGF